MTPLLEVLVDPEGRSFVKMGGNHSNVEPNFKGKEKDFLPTASLRFLDVYILRHKDNSDLQVNLSTL